MTDVKVFTVKAAEVSKTEVGKYGNNEITATIEDASGTTHQVTFLQKPASPVPAIGDTLEGTVEESQYGLKFKRAWKNNGGSFGGGGGYSDLDARIERQVAVKSATRIVSAWIAAGKIDKQDAAIAAIGAFTEDVVAIIRDDKKKAEGKAPAKTETVDSDIPF